MSKTTAQNRQGVIVIVVAGLRRRERQRRRGADHPEDNLIQIWLCSPVLCRDARRDGAAGGAQPGRESLGLRRALRGVHVHGDDEPRGRGREGGQARRDRGSSDIEHYDERRDDDDD